MSDRHKSFHVDKDDREVTFDVDGELFRCLPMVPGGVFREHVAQLLSTGAVKSRAWLAFIEVCMTPGEFERFSDYAAVPGNVGITEIDAIVNFLIEEYTSRPTKPSSLSERGRNETSPTSTGDSSSPESTPST